MSETTPATRSRLFRGLTPATNLLSAFGDLKETRLSATIGYLIHLNPRLPSLLFGIKGTVHGVYLEQLSEKGAERFDVVLNVSGKEHVVEVKILGQSKNQLERYSRSNSRLYLIGSHLAAAAHNYGASKHFLEWQALAATLRKTQSKGKTADRFYNELVEQFISHLMENNMIQADRGDVYIRDVSGNSADIYFRHNIYKCQPQFFRTAKLARYFAPYLTKSNSKGARKSVYSVLGTGISFMSRILNSSVVEEREITSVLKNHHYSRTATSEIFETFRWRKKGRRKYALFLLGTPMRLFSKPITKEDFWGIPGGKMPPMAIDFGDLVAAANGMHPLAKEKGRKLRS